MGTKGERVIRSDLRTFAGTPTWTIADRLIADGIAGVLVPSFARGATPADVNAVFWTWSNSVPHQVKAIDDEGRLPQDASSWH